MFFNFYLRSKNSETPFLQIHVREDMGTVLAYVCLVIIWFSRSSVCLNINHQYEAEEAFL